MRHLFVALSLVVLAAGPAAAQVNIGVGVSLPGVQIGINLPAYPNLVPVPGYPVYYAPQARANFFFYDGMYWVYQRDNWYASSWYNGPWWAVESDAVPLYVLRVPVRYYVAPPQYFQGWQRNQPPRWGEHWGPDWNSRHRDWDRWDRRAVPARAPLPTFQRQYSGARYPAPEQQPQILGRSYRYEPREPVVRQHYEVQRVKPQAAPPTRPQPQRQAAPPSRQPERIERAPSGKDKVRDEQRGGNSGKGNSKGNDKNDKDRGPDKRGG